MKNNCLIFMFLFCICINGYGQIPQISLGSLGNNVDSVFSHIFWGTFCIDSIYDMGSAYLITVISVDTIETNSPLMSSIKDAGVPFTVFSFKNGVERNENTIRKGAIYFLTLSPPEGVWTLFDQHDDDWGAFQSVQDSMGTPIKVPLPLIKTQLMLSSELIGLQYTNNHRSPVTKRKQHN